MPVLDRGGRIKGPRLDVLYPTHRSARRWGVRELTVTVWEYADGAPSDFETGAAELLAYGTAVLLTDDPNP